MTELGTVKGQLARLRREYCRRSAVIPVAAAFAVALLLALVFAAFDQQLHFHVAVRCATWLVLVSVLAAGMFLSWRRLRQQLPPSAVALMAERVLPNAENRLINAVQLAETRQDAAFLAEQILTEHALPLETVHGHDLTGRRPLRRTAWALAAAAVFFAVLMIISPHGTLQSLARLAAPLASLTPYSRTRILAVEPGEITVTRGEDVTVSVRLGGQVPDRAMLNWQQADIDDVLELPAREVASEDLRPDVRNYQAKITGLLADSRYRVMAGDARSPWYRIRVASPPTLLAWEADITPPAYLKRQPYRLLDSSPETELDVPAGSSVKFHGKTSLPLAAVNLIRDTQIASSAIGSRGGEFELTFTLDERSPVRLRLTGDNGLQAEEILPFRVVLDQPPNISVTHPQGPATATAESQVPLIFQAEDDHGLSRIGLEQITAENAVEPVTQVAPTDMPISFAGRFILDLPTFAARAGDTLRFRLWAEDNADGAMRHRSTSAVVRVRIPAAQEEKQAAAEADNRNRQDLLDLVRLQRANLQSTRNLAAAATTENTIDRGALQTVRNRQAQIRAAAAELLGQTDTIAGALRDRLAVLLEQEMAEVLVVLERVTVADPKENLLTAVTLETRILAALIGMPDELAMEKRHQQAVDLLAQLQKLVQNQAQNLKDTRALQNVDENAVGPEQLAQFQDRLANDLIVFNDQCWTVMEQENSGEMQRQVRAVYDLFDQRDLYETMLTASEALAFSDTAAAVEAEEKSLQTLTEGLNLLNQWRAENARDKLAAAAELLREVAAELAELEKKQARIAEVTRDLSNRRQLDDSVRDELAAMDREQEAMADTVEQLAQDLYQYPELPVCNELNAKMREIFEEVEQAADSENTPAMEIAVQKEDSLLDAIRNAKERVEDIEMWLPDAPDFIAWNMETFDADEFPDMPLVPLPDELEDIVGNLLEQAEAIDRQAQDATGNNMMADAEMGWDIMDGPMPNFSAKGKSGNTRPNDNEMTGRSGAGREGQAVGELVEDHVKGLEGRATEARRTQDPFQKGSVTEDEASTLDARATGGGKLGGESESLGMFGNAPRRDLNMPEHAAAAQVLRRETEALYAAARLLYLGTGSLGTAAAELKSIEGRTDTMQDFTALHRQVMRRLKQSQVEIANNMVLPMPVSTAAATGGAAIQDVDIGRIGEAYRSMVGEYYKGIQTQ
jgi:hypothetical protein